MKRPYLFLVICHLLYPSVYGQLDRIAADYINQWKAFYPSTAVALGIHELTFEFEQRDTQAIAEWITINENLLQAIANHKDSLDPTTRINASLLSMRADNELYDWQVQEIHKSNSTLYTDLLDQAVLAEHDMKYLTASEKDQLMIERAEDIPRLCRAAIANLSTVHRHELERSLHILDRLILAVQAQSHSLSTLVSDLQLLKEHLQTGVRIEDGTRALGQDQYAVMLALYTGDDLTPEVLAEMAEQEISDVRTLMIESARLHWFETYGAETMPADEDSVLDVALRDMGNDATSSAEEYTFFWNDLRDSLVHFIEKKDIVTLPRNQTLSITPAPESAGPSARVGWVSSAPPFDPNPWTTLYLPSIPDTVARQDQIEFWSSFNRPFNRMIAIHELFPGHYVQIKISRATPYPERLMFPYGPYFEGWATFCERVLLDQGWDADRPLTMLAHLRKRMENANRALMSVRVHCDGWAQEDVLRHSVKEALLAPQFAKSLWRRLMSSPMQMTSYFYGGRLFTDLLAAEQGRLAEAFDLKHFMDTIMIAGPIPIAFFHKLFQSE